MLIVNIIPQNEVGTDPAQGDVLHARKVDTAGPRSGARRTGSSPGLGIDVDVCQRKPDECRQVSNTGYDPHVTDNAIQLYALALGAVVQMGIDEWLRSNGRRIRTHDRSKVIGRTASLPASATRPVR